MNDNERILLKYICDNDFKNARKQARIVLNDITAKKDEQFRDNMIRKLDMQGNLLELPYNLRELLIAEDLSCFPDGKFLLRESEEKIVRDILSIRQVSEELSKKGISYLPALLLYGESGCGKTELARYIAYKAKLPFVYVKFSNLIDSHLGATQSNIAKIFDYVRSSSCVLCFDEIDAIGMARGQEDDVGEMNRIVIAMMQEFDRTPNNVIIIGTTNRFDRLDSALVRRFPLQHKIIRLKSTEAQNLALKFFQYAGYKGDEWLDWSKAMFPVDETASAVINRCTQAVVEKIISEKDFGTQQI